MYSNSGLWHPEAKSCFHCDTSPVYVSASWPVKLSSVHTDLVTVGSRNIKQAGLRMESVEEVPSAAQTSVLWQSSMMGKNKGHSSSSRTVGQRGRIKAVVPNPLGSEVLLRSYIGLRSYSEMGNQQQARQHREDTVEQEVRAYFPLRISTKQEATTSS